MSCRHKKAVDFDEYGFAQVWIPQAKRNGEALKWCPDCGALKVNVGGRHGVKWFLPNSVSETKPTAS